MAMPVFSEPVPRKTPEGVQEYELNISGSKEQLFQDWVAAATDEQLHAYFKAVCDGIESRQLEHYHFKINNGRYDHRTRSQRPEWRITIFYGGNDDVHDGPLEVSRCMSCDLDCPLVLGVLGEAPPPPAAAAAAAAVSTAASAATTTTVTQLEPASASAPGDRGTAASPADADHGSAATAAAAAAPAAGLPAEAAAADAVGSSAAPAPAVQQQQQQQQQQQGPLSRDSLIKETEHSRVWLDAKARPMFVITPKPHLERLADLSQQQLVDLFRTAAAILQDMGCSSFNTMVLNHGDSRNHAHLHLKVRVRDQEFEQAAAGWSSEHRTQLQALKRFRDSLPPEQRGTREAFLLRQRARRQQQQQQDEQPWRRQRQQQGWQGRGQPAEQQPEQHNRHGSSHLQH